MTPEVQVVFDHAMFGHSLTKREVRILATEIYAMSNQIAKLELRLANVRADLSAQRDLVHVLSCPKPAPRERGPGV
jgi:hypothetical protein